MSTFEDERYRWRETYFVLFSAAQRPALKTVEKRLATLSKRYTLTDLNADKQGRFESLTLVSPDDFAALDICYTSGVEVMEQVEELVEEMTSTVDPGQRQVLKQIRQCDGRFDVLHFEQVADLPEENGDGEEMLDPSALLAVLDELARMTGGIAVDPQSGTIMGSEEG